jgi:hypothetical protein
LFARIAATLESDAFIAAHRVGPADFTRRRTLTFSTLVTTLAQGFVKGLQSELDDFFGRLTNQAGFVRTVSKSAFSQARKKLCPSVFRALNELLLTQWAAAVAVPRWHGFRLLAGDSTTLRLPALPETLEAFGVHGDRWGGATPMAQAFGLYDTASGLMVHADLYPAQAREREMLTDSLRHVRPDDLLLLDRGFPAYWLFAWLRQQDRHFWMRVDALGFTAIEQFAYASTADEAVVEINIPAPAARQAAAKGYELATRVVPLRLIRIRLPSGQMEILATSLLDQARYPVAEFAALYHQRWRIEESFKLLKCRLAVEHFSGELPESVRQDFLAKVWLGNLTATFAYLARTSLDATKQVHFTPNLTYTVAALRAVLPRLMLNLAKGRNVLRHLLDLIARTLEWVRPNRYFPRTRQAVKPTRHRAYKSIR